MEKIRTMKYLFIIFTEFVHLVSSQKNDFKFLPNLPMGEYRVNYKAILKCKSDPNSQIGQNYFLSKLSVNETELRGNLTLNIPLDDSLTMKVNMAVKDSIGGWKDNAHVIALPKACSTLKHYLGPEWPIFMKSLGVKDLNCPILPGVYVSKGYSLTNVTAYFPKTFFYGTYKSRCYFTDSKNNEHGCAAFVVEIKRPWEME